MGSSPKPTTMALSMSLEPRCRLYNIFYIVSEYQINAYTTDKVLEEVEIFNDLLLP